MVPRTALIALVTLVLFALASCTSEADESTTTPESPSAPVVFEAAIAQCLTNNGVAMYGADTCPACRQQKTLFGDSFGDVTYVECDKSEACQREGIRSIPTWIRADGERLVGMRSLDALAQWAGCDAIARV